MAPLRCWTGPYPKSHLRLKSCRCQPLLWAPHTYSTAFLISLNQSILCVAKRSLNSPQASRCSFLIGRSQLVAQALILNPAASVFLQIDSELSLSFWFYLFISKHTLYPPPTLPRPPSSLAGPVAASPASATPLLPSPALFPCTTGNQGDPTGFLGCWGPCSFRLALPNARSPTHAVRTLPLQTTQPPQCKQPKPHEGVLGAGSLWRCSGSPLRQPRRHPCLEITHFLSCF